MISKLYVAKELDLQVSNLQRAGAKGAFAAQKYREILQYLRTGDEQNLQLVQSRTRHGEKRLRNCMKYRLGGGYRLITILLDTALYIPFAGSHDDAHLWIERHRNSGFFPLQSSYKEEDVTPLPTLESPTDEMTHLPEEDDLYEQGVLAEIDDTVLKSIFFGLFRGVHNG